MYDKYINMYMKSITWTTPLLALHCLFPDIIGVEFKFIRTCWLVCIKISADTSPLSSAKPTGGAAG